MTRGSVVGRAAEALSGALADQGATVTLNGRPVEPAPTRRRQLITGGNPDAPFQVPVEARFVDGDEAEIAYIDAPDLQLIARRLIEHRLKFLGEIDIRYLWKAEGGKSSGRTTFGKCIKPSGLADYALRCDLVIWLAADHVRDYRFTAYQVEALLYHELLHAGIGTAGQPKLNPHDLEIFRAEVEEYGMWMPALKEAETIFQPRLVEL